MSDDLRDFFSEISKSKKEKKEKLEEAKEELNTIVGDLGLDSLFQEFGKIKKEEVVKKKKQEKKLEAFENFFSNIDEKKEEEPVVEIEEVIEEQEEIIEEPVVAEEEIEEEIVAEEEIEEEKFEEEVEEVLEDVSLIEKSLGMLAATDNNEDPLTPVDKKFATMEDFQKHYGLLIQRIQQQLSTIGGGGAVNIRDLDDIDLSTAQVNNKFLKYNSASGKWVGSDTSGGGYTLPTAASDTLGGIKIGSGLSIDGDGVVTASGGGGGGSIAGIDTSNTSTFNNVDITGITTIGNVVVGGATTDLIVDGDARVTGILTIGAASITLDPNAKTITGLDEIEIGTGDNRIKLKKSSRGTIDFVDKDNKSIGGIGTEAVFNTTGIMTATRFRTIGGTATQFLKADGSVDTNTYLNSTHDASNVTNTKIGNWDAAYGWGDHSSGGYAASSHNHDSSYNNYTHPSHTGDVTGSAALTIANDAVTYAKIQNVATANRVLGSSSADGVVSEIQVATDMIADDAVTTDKLADAINTTIAANTSKVTNATHTGDVTGSAALTIADDKIEEKHINAGGTPGADKVLVYDSSESTNWKWEDQSGSGGGGSSTFLGLSDTPGSFTANKLLKVNSAGNAIELVDTSSSTTTVTGQLNLSGMSKETINIVANKLSAATDIDLEDGLVHYFSTLETTDATPNIRYNSSTTLNSKLSVGDSITVVIISVTDNTNDSYEQLTIDGSAVAEQWIGGHPPGGGATGYDMYSYNIIKTDDATWLVFANKVNYT